MSYETGTQTRHYSRLCLFTLSQKCQLDAVLYITVGVGEKINSHNYPDFFFYDF